MPNATPPVQHPRPTPATHLFWTGFGIAAAVILGFASLFLTHGCKKQSSQSALPVSPEARLYAKHQQSSECQACHQDIYRAWAGSHHAQAHRPASELMDADAFQPERSFKDNDVDYTLGWREGRPFFHEKHPGKADFSYTADFVLGFTPLRQYIVPTGKGHYQAAELAFDPHKKEWFNVFGGENRRPGEWGHWRGRGMNWNSMCAHCHTTNFRKNFDSATDTYSSKWLEHGVGCVQCHENIKDEHLLPGYKTARNPTPPYYVDRTRAMETCAPCHARNELLSGHLVPGGKYTDHYRLTLPVDRGIYYPDGQQRDEDFNYTSLLISRMGGKAGVTCLDCHDPHTMKTKLPAKDNSLCMQCHKAPGFKNAPLIDPTAHSHHKADSTGNICIECHMPTTPYMQRDPRHDHGFLKPDPLLNRELGIPDACTKCHADKGVDWNIEWADKWYGAKLASRQRDRARAVAAAQNAVPTAGRLLEPLIATEDIPAWKATLILLSRPYVASNPKFIEHARAGLADSDPMVRSACIQVLAAIPAELPNLRPLLKDPSRLVRLDAQWALSRELPDDSVERKELDAYMALGADQPAGLLRIAQDLANRGRLTEAEPLLRKAIDWDPNSGGFHETLGLVLDQLGRPSEAADALWQAAKLNTNDGQAAYYAALAYAGANRLDAAETALREAVKRDARLDRAWYNLGLLLAQTNRAVEAITSLEKAEAIAPGVADYPYARATVLWQLGNRTAALTAARRALQLNPNHAEARAMLGGQ